MEVDGHCSSQIYFLRARKNFLVNFVCPKSSNHYIGITSLNFAYQSQNKCNNFDFLYRYDAKILTYCVLTDILCGVILTDVNILFLFFPMSGKERK